MSDTQVLRIGKISSINYEKGTARVTYEDRDGSTTVELPFLAWEYWMPSVEDRVVVGHLSNGTTSAVILGPVWHDDHRPAEGAQGIYRKEYAASPGTAYERYDASDGSLTIVAGGCTLRMKDGNITVNGSLAVTGGLTAGSISVSGNLSVGGAVNADGAITAGSINTDGNITADSISTSGDVMAGSISAQNHTHTGVNGETSGPH